jgi:hypothetical protein
MADNKASGGIVGIGWFSVLFFIFLVLKLCGQINWSWWWITAPLWCMPLLFIVIVLIIAGGSLAYESLKKKR